MDDIVTNFKPVELFPEMENGSVGPIEIVGKRPVVCRELGEDCLFNPGA